MKRVNIPSTGCNPLTYPSPACSMDLMEHVRRPVVDGVRLAVASDGSSLEGSLCISAFFLIYSTRRQAADEINVR